MERMRPAIMILTALLAGPAAAQSTGSDIVREALEGVRQDQARDSARVRAIIDEAVRGAEEGPSGSDTVNPMAPEVLRPLPADAPDLLAVGYSAEELIGRAVDDGTGAQIGVIRDLVADETSSAPRVLVEFAPLFGQPGKTSAVPVEALTTAVARGEGYVMELTAVAFEQLPAYVPDGELWRRADG
jgi:hypothetical protein